MNFFTLIKRSLRFHARSHLGVVLGAAVGSAALVGALAVGDSVRGSLRQKALERVGQADYLLAPGDRFFSDADATWARAFGGSNAIALQLPAVGSARNAEARANAVRVYGVSESFWQYAPSPTNLAIGADGVCLNEALATQLQVGPGDEVLFRLHKPSALSREMPIAPVSDASVALRLKVQAVLAPAQFGNFSRTASQIPPFNAFVRRDVLQRATGLTNRANLALVRHTGEAAELDRQLRSAWRLADAELELVFREPSREVVLNSSRIFLEPAVLKVATNAFANARPILTYLANQIRAGTNGTPYSMVAAAGPPWTRPGLGTNEIVINQWLADDLKLGPGDGLELTYFQPESGAELVEQTNWFQVKAVVPLEGMYADRQLMPEFPGISKAESTHDWDAGFPLVHTIRPKDEAYWKQQRGTPKAFVSPATGQALWANRFGEATSVRFPVPAETNPADFQRTVGQELLARLAPEMLGMRFEPARAQALAAANQAQDFGQLFIGFSFFLIMAALMLMALLFQFGLEQRAAETGTLLALGFTPRQVRRYFWAEGTVLAFLGGVVGVGIGVLYARALLYGLTTIWSEAIAGAGLQFYVSSLSLLAGLSAALIASALTIRLVLRQQARRPARELLSEGAELDTANPTAKPGRSLIVGLVSLAGALGLVGWAVVNEQTAAAGIFFGAGSLLLLAGLALGSTWLRQLARRQAGSRLTTTGLGIRGATRRRRRSLAVAALLACGSFLVIAIGAFKLDAQQDASRRGSGTGGFALIGESTLPVLRDLNTSAGREFYALNESDLPGVSLVPMRVRSGDDASCLNLNRAQNPRLLGVNPDLLARRGAFTFAKTVSAPGITNGWQLLTQNARGGTNRPVIPAIGDQNSILWALGKKVGDTLDYVDERGQTFQVQIVGALANSVLQGSLLINEAEFIARFPGESGYRMFLVDAPSNAVATVTSGLTRALQDVGLELTPTVRRLAAFNAVQNTYLNTFQVLGGLGLLLGSAGLGVVVLRNVLERRGELALLQSVGFRRSALHWLVLSEHAALLLLGLGIGMAAALTAVFPALRAPGSEVPWRTLSLTIAAVMASGLIWTWVATRVACKGQLLAALRNE